MSKILFKETQGFRQWWIWIIHFVLGLVFVYIIYKQLILHEVVGDNPASDFVVIINTLLVLGSAVLFKVMKLSTEIYQERIVWSFYPFVRKKELYWEQIQTAEVIDYGFVGGWGIRLLTKYGTVYNTSGKTGLALQTKSGKKFLIGTQKCEELKRVIRKCLSNITEEIQNK